MIVLLVGWKFIERIRCEQSNFEVFPSTLSIATNEQ